MIGDLISSPPYKCNLCPGIMETNWHLKLKKTLGKSLKINNKDFMEAPLRQRMATAVHRRKKYSFSFQTLFSYPSPRVVYLFVFSLFKTHVSWMIGYLGKK